jgi:hypothetical protein
MSYAHALDRIENLGIPPEISKPILESVNRWLTSSGPEWTVGRLKELKQWYIHWLCGKPYEPQGSWVAMRDGIPRGPFRALFNMKPSRKVFNCLLIYTGFISPRVTTKQAEKFFSSVESEPIDRLPHIPYLKHVAESLNPLVPDRKTLDYHSYGWSNTKYAPVSDMTTRPESIDCLFEDFKSSLVWDLLDDPGFEGIIWDAMGDLTLKLLKVKESGDYGDCVGRISVVQEPGYKARFLANPRRVFQLALRPIGQQLLKLLQQIPWDCTHNQAEGPFWAQAQLRAGKTVYSVDLSDATNNFPLSLQVRVLHWLDSLNTEDIRLFECLAKGRWFVPKSVAGRSEKPEGTTLDSPEGQSRFISWTKGQPLGLYPSFPAFALTHGCLLRAIELKVGVSDTFRVLGDDVVISDDGVHAEYRRYLDLFRMPVSESKTISSDKLAEFAGVLITPSTCYTGVKWRHPTSNLSLHLLSSLTRNLDLTDRREFLAYILKSAPPPYGEGRNPEGLPLRARAALFRPWLNLIQDQADFTQLERPTKHSLWYGSAQAEYPEVCAWHRDDLEVALTAICDEWNRNHPYSQLDRDVYQDLMKRQFLSLGPKEVWARLVDRFEFINLDCPDALINGGWLDTKTGMKYLAQGIDDRIRERLRNRDVIGRWVYRIHYQEQMQWYKLSSERKEQRLQEALMVILSSPDKP